MKALCALLFCFLSSCVSIPASPAVNAITGEWRYADRIQSCHYVFERGGKFHGDVTYQQKLLSRFTGSWSVNGNALNYKYENDALGRIAPGTTDRDKLLEVQRDFFVIEAADGSRRKYRRVH